MQGRADALGPQAPRLPPPHAPNILNGRTRKHAVDVVLLPCQGKHPPVGRMLFGHMCGNLGKGARCSNPNGNCDSRLALNALPHIAAEFGQIGPLGGLKPQKGFINGVRLRLSAALLQNIDHPRGNIAVQRVI